MIYNYILIEVVRKEKFYHLSAQAGEPHELNRDWGLESRKQRVELLFVI
jgi:hypothetical protein